jgi:hypothetical protein
VSFLRSVAAVLAGLLEVVVLSLGTDAVLHGTGVFPPPDQPMGDVFYLMATAYRALYAVVGSYVAARLAPARAMEHALALGGVALVINIAGAVMTWGRSPAFGPTWYPIALVFLALPAAWAGGALALMRPPEA